jgi:DNA topoisomerase-3
MNKEEKFYGGARKGNKDDNSHPPIHPVKLADETSFQTPSEQKIYDFLVKNFLASLSRDAIADETSLEVTLGNEIFKTSGIVV